MAASTKENRKRERGSTTVETVGILLFVFMAISALLFVAYVIFAMGWIRFQSEQGLYCMAEGRFRFSCTREVKKNLNAFLPSRWTDRLDVNLSGDDQEWSSRIVWKIKGFKIDIRRELSIDGIRRGRRALCWSAGSSSSRCY